MNQALAERTPPVRRRSARFVLRDATDAIHQRMHRHAGYAAVAAGVIGRAAYARLLARSLGFYAPVEPLAGLDGTATMRLVEDLSALGMTQATIDALPRCSPPAIGDGVVERLGAAYVLSGAALGGLVMARALPTTFPARFLGGEAGEGMRWRGFVDRLDQTCVTDDHRARATHAAVTTFAAFEDWMNGWAFSDAR